MSSAFDPQNPLKRPDTPSKTSWFEFLLNPALLEEHLQKEWPEPSATDLIALFLQQSDVAATTAKEIKDGLSDAKLDNQSEKGDDVESKKVQALKSLALKVASHLKWNLAILEEGLPIAMVHQLLMELLSATLPGIDPSPKHHPNLDLARSSGEALFAILLYHRWCLRTAVKDSFPVKPSKVAKVQVPGLLDPSVQYASLKENISRMVKDNIDDSIAVLEHYLRIKVSVCLPSLMCFGCVSEEVNYVMHDWSLGTTVSAEEVSCQACYDLGSMYFHQQIYEKAYQVFREAFQLRQQLQDAVFCSVEPNKLSGYLTACSGILGRPNIVTLESPEAKLTEAIEATRAEHFEGVTTLLLQDNMKCHLSLSYRTALESDVRSTSHSLGLYQEVVTCNAVRSAMEGRTSPSQYLQMLNQDPRHVEFLLEVASNVVKTATFSQKSHLKYFIRYLCYNLSPELQFVVKLMESELKPLFTSSELDSLSVGHHRSDRGWKLVTQSHFPEPVDDGIQLGELERQLLVSHDPVEIKALVQKVSAKLGKHQTMFLTDKWRLPKELHHAIESLPVSQQSFTAYVHILVAKARLIQQLEMYPQSREMLSAAEAAIKEISYKLTKLLKWEVLKVDLLQHHSSDTLAPGLSVPDLAKRAKNCLTTLKTERDGGYGELFSQACAFLLNVRELDYFAGLNKTGGLLEVSQLMACLSKELQQMRNARKAGRDLWDAVVLIFTTSTQQKRSAGGATSNVTRESNLGPVASHIYIKLLSKLKDPVLLSGMISLSAKLYNIIKDDGEISSDHVTLWPSALANPGTMNMEAMTQALTTVLDRGLELYPNEASWLRTQADVHYANGQHAQAMRYYLQVGVVMTDFFTKPLAGNVYDDGVYKRMIKCCSYLQCHTQVAVLCQFLEDVDYTTAFKVLQERTTHDAADSYYNCIWDVTILEYLVYLHGKRGEIDKKQQVLKFIGQMELNSNNPSEILFEAAKLRKRRFLQALAKEYM